MRGDGGVWYRRAGPGGWGLVRRMSKVQDYMNSTDFKARDGGGLAALAQSLRERCRRVCLLEGERLRT